MAVKKIFPFLFVLSALFFIIYGASDAIAIDAPHDYTNTIACATCHPDRDVLPPWLIGNASADSVCMNCHDNPAILMGDRYRLVTTHSSANTSSTYGMWAIECRTCHNPHYQWQAVVYPTEGYVENGRGTISVVVVNSVLTDQGLPPKTWTTDAFKGYLLVPNTSSPTAIYRIIGNTATTITVAGADFADANSSINYGVKYGKLINDNITTPNSGNKEVKFFNNTGANSFANDNNNATPTGICQVCHTRTQSFKNTGTLEAAGLHPNAKEGADCTICHKHTEGFKVTGCDSCHGNPPTTLPDIAIGGPNGLVAITKGGTGATTPGAHQKHAVTLAYTCNACHTGGMTESAPYDQKIQIGFNIFNVYKQGMYNGRTSLSNGYVYASGDTGTTVTSNGGMTCTNIYCHSIVQTGTGGTLTVNTLSYATPAWSGNPMTCTSCHGNPSATGSHLKHAGDGTNQYGFSCEQCHSGYVPPMPPGVTTHVNGAINTSIHTTWGGTYNGDTTPGNGFSTCSNVYCHGNGVDTNTQYATPTWGNAGTGACGTCHGVNASAPPTSERHTKHVGTSAGYTYSCSKCHSSVVSETANATSAPTIASTSLHVNKIKNVSWDAFNTNGSPYSTGSPCTNLYCHSKGTSATASTPNITPSWTGAFDTTCTGCHNGDSSASNNMDTGSHSKHVVSSNYDCAKCHNETVSNSRSIRTAALHVNKLVDVKFDTATNLNSAATYNSTLSPVAKTPGTSFGACTNIYCHSNGTSVSTGTILANTSPSWGAPGPLACNTCHGAGTSDGKPSYLQDQPKSNSHEVHVTQAHYPCNYCHYGTTSTGTTITNPLLHANGVYDVQYDPTVRLGSNPSIPINFTYTYDAGGGICSNNCCHASSCNNTKTWGYINLAPGINYQTGPGCYEVSLTGSVTLGTPPYTFAWDFGDNSPLGTGQTVSHTYAGPGPYNAKLTVRDKNNHSGEITTPVSPVAANLPPVADKKPVTVSGCTVTLTDLSRDPDYNTCGHSGSGSITIQWGDGKSTSSSINLTAAPSNIPYTHVYTSAGTYTISHFVSDNALSATIQSTPNASVSIVPPSITIAGTITGSTGSPVSGARVDLKKPDGGPYKTVYTDTNGYYISLDNSGQCSYIVEPYSFPPYSFVPVSQTVTSSNSAVNFIRSP